MGRQTEIARNVRAPVSECGPNFAKFDPNWTGARKLLRTWFQAFVSNMLKYFCCDFCLASHPAEKTLEGMLRYFFRETRRAPRKHLFCDTDKISTILSKG